MITTYHRPKSLDDALKLLSRRTPITVPLGGGTVLSHQRGEDIEVVDLQALGLNGILERGKLLEVGATVTLQQLLEDARMFAGPGGGTPSRSTAQLA